jgi:molybdopterin/thiamine biosynthesis adenylyltransferase
MSDNAVLPIAVEAEDDRFARFRLIGWWDQERLRNARVVVVGAGALGNEILKNLALLGIGNIFIADMDSIEHSNLSRSILYRQKDNGRSKAQTAADAVRDIYPQANVQWFNGNVVHDLGLGVFAWADVVIGGLDNREARLAINRNCLKVNRPWIDGAIEQLNGVARVFVPPKGACYECTMNETDWEMLKARRSCNLLSRDDMLAGKTPTTPTSASIIAAVQCQEAVKLLHGMEVITSKGFVYNGLTSESYIVEYPRKPECWSHERFEPVQKTGLGVHTTRLGDMLETVRKTLGPEAVIEFNGELLFSLECPSCGKVQPVLKSLGKTTVHEGRCPDCNVMRTVQTFHSIDGSERFLDMTFGRIGVPPFDIIVGRNGDAELYLEFDADRPAVLGSLPQADRRTEGRENASR